MVDQMRNAVEVDGIVDNNIIQRAMNNLHI
jgi:hypothetical protein